MSLAIGRFAVGAGVVCALLLPPSNARSAQDPPEADASWKKETLQWFEPVGAGGTVRVTNPHGAVYARFGGYENRVELLATAQRIDKGLPPLEVRRSRSGPDLEVVVAEEKEQGGKGSPDAEARSKPRRDRIDLVVFVPQGIGLDVQTDADRIEIKGLKGPVSARTVKGDVWIRSVDGPVSAESRRGNIFAALGTGVTDRPQRFSTETGDIEIDVWEDARFTAHLETSGEISTDFSIDIEYRKLEEPGKLGTARLNGGGPELTLASKRGHVSLVRLPGDFKAEEQDVD